MNTKRIRRNVLLTAFSIILVVVGMRSTPLVAAEAKSNVEIFDAYEYLTFATKEKVGAPRAITRTPVFTDAPFLKLKPGNRIVKGKRWVDHSKNPKDYHFEKKESYFLLANNKYYLLGWVQDKSDKLRLSSGSYSLLFDWEFSLANATILQQRDEREFGENITVESFTNLKKNLQKEFPESLRDAGKVTIQAPHLKGDSKTRRSIFQGLGFDNYRNTISKYQIEVGNGIYIFKQKKLIVGPQRTDRYGVEIKETRINRYFNAAGRQPTPAEVAKARNAEERATKFRDLVNGFLFRPTPIFQG